MTAGAPPAARLRPAPPRRPSTLATVVKIVTVVLVAGALGVVIAIVVKKRVDTGAWQLPTTRDFVQVRDHVAEKIGVAPSEPPVARVIFLDRRPRTVRPGTDDAPTGTSSVVAHQGTVERKLPGWKGSDKAWKQMVACVQKLFAPFDVTVTDEEPTTPEHALVVVGGKPKDLGVKDTRVAGLAPFNGLVIPRPVVFAFAATQSHQAQAVCETIGMEVAHAYGLDHEYLCSDVMSYLKPCGKRKFVDKDARCGEHKARDCAASAGPTQNSHRRLLAVFGPRPPAPQTP